MLTRKLFLWALLAIVLVRVLVMALIPLIDTSEPRYAEIARLMLESNDWITLWFEPGMPFWGKPPLAFWAQALGFKLLGVNEFSARLPALLATLATAWLLFRLGLALTSVERSRLAVLLFLTTAVVFMTSGAVLTDPFLMLGISWSLCAFWLAPSQSSVFWRYGFFMGLVLGVLAKGPLALVLVFGVIGLWGLLNFSGLLWRHLRALPWLSGSLLFVVLTLPWFVLAELRTPGFLNYFIIGEHFLRFVDPGWNGDLYGTAHQQPKGMIWLYWLQAAFPASALMVITMLTVRASWRQLRDWAAQPAWSYLLIWTLLTPVFFSLAGNVLWTYVLPGMPALALLLVTAWPDSALRQPWVRRSIGVAVGLLPVVALGFTVYIVQSPNEVKTEKQLIAYAQAMGDERQPLVYYLGKVQFSARFYAREQVAEIDLQALRERRLPGPGGFVAIPKHHWQRLGPALGLGQPVYENRRYYLVWVSSAETMTPAPEKK